MTAAARRIAPSGSDSTAQAEAIYVWRSGTLIHAWRCGDWATSTDEADAVQQVRQSDDDYVRYGEPA